MGDCYAAAESGRKRLLASGKSWGSPVEPMNKRFQGAVQEHKNRYGHKWTEASFARGVRCGSTTKHGMKAMSKQCSTESESLNLPSSSGRRGAGGAIF